MAHTHTHEHSHANYYLEQLLTIAFCGALGVVMVLLYQWDVLPIFLDQKFHGPLLWGAIALLALVAIRAVSLWVSVGRTGHTHEHSPAEGGEHHHEHDHDHCHHDHEHGEACEHHHDHDHDHTHSHEHVHAEGDDCGHDHGFAPWRYMVLMLPVALFFLKLPWPDPPEPVDANVFPLKLAEAEEAAESPQKQELYADKGKETPIQLKGLVKWVGTRNGRQVFQFVRLRMTCCFADAYPQDTAVFVDSDKPVNTADYQGKWVKAAGQLTFPQGANGKPVVVLKAASVKLISPPANQFDN